jgi:hypothetical protein
MRRAAGVRDNQHHQRFLADTVMLLIDWLCILYFQVGNVNPMTHLYKFRLQFMETIFVFFGGGGTSYMECFLVMLHGQSIM